MSRIAVLGEPARVEGYALGGALVLPADTPEEVAAAWATLPPEVVVVVLTPAAAAHVDGERPESPERPELPERQGRPRRPGRPGLPGAAERPEVLTVVMPS